MNMKAEPHERSWLRVRVKEKLKHLSPLKYDMTLEVRGVSLGTRKSHSLCLICSG